MPSSILTPPDWRIAFASGCMCCQESFAKMKHQVAQQGRFPSAYKVRYCAASRMNTASLYSYIPNTSSLAALPVRDHLLTSRQHQITIATICFRKKNSLCHSPRFTARNSQMLIYRDPVLDRLFQVFDNGWTNLITFATKISHCPSARSGLLPTTRSSNTFGCKFSVAS